VPLATKTVTRPIELKSTAVNQTTARGEEGAMEAEDEDDHAAAVAYILESLVLRVALHAEEGGSGEEVVNSRVEVPGQDEASVMNDSITHDSGSVPPQVTSFVGEPRVPDT
jgi:hypothetical protein